MAAPTCHPLRPAAGPPTSRAYRTRSSSRRPTGCFPPSCSRRCSPANRPSRSSPAAPSSRACPPIPTFPARLLRRSSAIPAAAPLPPLIPATAHRENEDSPLAALFREREPTSPKPNSSCSSRACRRRGGALPSMPVPSAPCRCFRVARHRASRWDAADSGRPPARAGAGREHEAAAVGRRRAPRRARPDRTVLPRHQAPRNCSGRRPLPHPTRAAPTRPPRSAPAPARVRRRAPARARHR